MAVDTFTVSAATEDGGGSNGGSGTWPPTVPGSYSSDEAGNDCLVGWSFSGGQYFCDVGFFRWDCSAIPDTDVITAVSFKPVTSGTPTMADTPNDWKLEGEWYDFGGEPSTSADWKGIATTPCFSVLLSSLAAGADARQTIVIPSDFSGVNIDETGFTGLRCTLNRTGGAAPTTLNIVNLRAFEYSSGSFAAQLVVTHSPAGPVTAGLSRYIDWRDHPRFIHRKAR